MMSVEDSVLEFDLNYLQYPNNVECDSKLQKQRKAVLCCKKKIIATESLIAKYYDKNEKLRQSELHLFAAKEECKQVCIDKKSILEKCTMLEKDIKLLKARNKELEDDCSLSKSQLDAMKSHIHQLQALAKIHERTINSLKLEKNDKDTKKKESSIEKEHKTLLSHICLLRDIVYGKKKLKKHHKLLLKTYDKLQSKEDLDGSSNDAFDSLPASPMFEHEITSLNKNGNEYNTNEKEKMFQKAIEDHESDYSNVVSEDTGRGSSLTFYDINSPEYFNNDSPFTIEANKIKEKKILANVGTSPLRDYELVHTATSPVTFDDPDYVTHDTIIENGSEVPELLTSDISLSDDIVTIKEKKKMIDIATSPVRNIVQVHTSTSPVMFEDNLSTQINLTDNSQVNINNDHDSAYNFFEIPLDKLCNINKRKHHIDEISSQCELEISGEASSVEKRNCLERNNSINLCSEHNDVEIEKILSSMRLAYNLISPIPNTPVKSSEKKHKNQQPAHSPLPDVPRTHTVSPDVIELREDNKVIHTKLADITKEIMNLKHILLSKILTPTIPQQCTDVSCKEPLQNNSSQDIITEGVDSNNDQDVYIDANEFSEVMDKEITPPRQVIIISDIQSTENVDLHNNQNSIEILSECSDITNVNIETEAETCDKISITKASVEKNNVENPILKSPIVVITCEDVDKCNSLIENESYSLLSDKDEKKNVKSKRLSKLDKFRKKLLPKSKIAKDTEPPKQHFKSKLKSASKPEPLMDMNAVLNKKLAYEKAVIIMKELKLKEKDKNDRKIIIRESKKKKVTNKIDETKNNDSITEQDKSEYVTNKQHKVSYSNVRKVTSKDECFSDQERDTIINSIATRSRSRTISNRDSMFCIDSTNNGAEGKGCAETPRKQVQVNIDNLPDSNCTRVLRSTTRRYSDDENLDVNISKIPEPPHKASRKRKLDEGSNSIDNKKLFENPNEPLHLFNTNDEIKGLQLEENGRNINHPKESILCKMIEKYGKDKVRFAAKKVPDNISNSICKKLEDSIAHIIELPVNKVKPAMSKLVDDLLKNWNVKNFLTGLNKYLKDPARKRELFNKVSAPPAPPMSKSEQVLLYIVKQLQLCVPDIVDAILNHIEFTLFQLNKTPEFDVIESMSHFYALVCRYFGLKMRLRLFVLDAMYCLSFKVVPLIRQCLDVWMHILPLAHMGIAKSPLVTCLVYLLHFYKCEDKFKRVQDIRFILYKKYFYKITDWNENKILEMFRTSIMELRDISVEKKMLRTALIILAKRQGPKWCQKNIVKKILIPIIDQDVPIKIKQFCVAVLGPLLRPYPMDMKVHCEIVVNNLLDMLDQNPPESLKEAIFTSLIYMNRHSQDRVTQALLSWCPKQVSPEFSQLIQAFVQEKPVKVWKGILSRLTS